MSHLHSARRFLLAAVLVVLSLAPPRAGAQADNSADAGQLAQDVASAGRLRMQSQRLAKLYQQARMGMNLPAAARQITQASADVDAELGRISRYAKQANIRRLYGRSEAIWQEMRATLKSRPTRVDAERVNQLADELMIHSGKLAMLIEAETETPVGRLLDLSSRLNMLVHRLARLYLQAQVGDQAQGIRIDIEQARKEFASGLHELAVARENSPASREAVALAKNQWIFFDLAISQLGAGSRGDDRAAQNVATSSERIGQMLDDVAAQYVKDYADSRRARK